MVWVSHTDVEGDDRPNILYCSREILGACYPEQSIHFETKDTLQCVDPTGDTLCV